MKKIVGIAAAFLLFGLFAGAQTIEKGSLISIHTIELTAHQNIPVDRIINFLENELYPAFAKELGCDIKLMKGLNRETENKIGVVYYYSSKQHFNRFWNDNGDPTEEGNKALSHVEHLRVEFRELGESKILAIQDWSVN
ncbi:hypothetical protein [Draconibacterium sp.]|uniref:hypothetical protein n=1 Tax=Draconibacterium sp. TaxID=1965318 RepID=UPI003568B7D4